MDNSWAICRRLLSQAPAGSSLGTRLSAFYKFPGYYRYVLSFFGDALQIRQTRLKVLADQFVHVEERRHHLEHEGLLAAHRPGDVRGVPLRFQRENSGVVCFERLEEIQFDRELGRRRRFRDLHASLADFLISFPLVDRARAAGWTAVGSLQVGIDFLPGRPGRPIVEVVEKRKDLLRRRLDGCSALN